jgi:hypothetical protein
MEEKRFEDVKTPVGFRFADLSSEFAYRHAVAGTPGPLGRLPIVVINSARPGAGKSSLARLILEKRMGEELRVGLCCTATVMGLSFPRALKNGYLWLDDVREALLRSSELLSFASCQRWGYRPLGKEDMVEMEIPENFQIIITGLGLVLPVDLARRSIVINLE